jgi:prevent-host-death family protein
MKLSRDIQTVSELKQNASKLIKQVNETGQPIVLTLNGKPAAVIQDVESFERMAAAADHELTIMALDEALKDFDERQTWPTYDEVFTKFRRTNEIP